MASFPQASPPTPCAHLYPSPYAPHVLPISVHPSESMNPPQGIYGGKAAGLVNRCYNTYHYTLLIYWNLTHKHVNLKDWPRHNCCYNTFTALLVLVPLSSIKSHIWMSYSGLSLPFSRKQVACRHAHLKNIVFNKERLYTATYHYNMKENLSLFWKWGVLDLYHF